MQVTAQPQDGTRTFDMDRANQIVTHEEYINFPSGLVVTRSGAIPGKVALTFDDGPSPDWTPQILDVLKAKGVHATFFIVGVNAPANPALVARMVAEGHDVGNHTFTHPNLAAASEEVVRVELNASQRLFQALTGRAMRLFRPPYIGDAEPRSPDAIEAIKIAHELGYITVGLKVDPGDWLKPPAARIVARVLAQVSDPNPELAGQIVLLHDAGGDRTQTLAALPMLIDSLRARGFTLAPMSELAGLSHDQAMPLFPNEPLMPAVNSSVFLLTEWLQYVLHWMIVAAIGLGFARLAGLVALAVLGRFRTPVAVPLAAHDGVKVSVLIPAFNEAMVIAGSIRRILDCTYQNFEVIVIDDGSADHMAAIVRKSFGNDPRVRLLCIANSGKAQAINTGPRSATGDVIVALDADTQFEPETIARLTRWFADPSVGAVAGNAKVGNRINALTRWHALEYVTAQNLERRALVMLGCMTVVPGAVGAWRLSALQQLGGFPRDTLAEDQDLTTAIQKAGHKIVFDPEAVAWTEAPDTLGALAKQRLRWSFGTLQCLWKHGDVTFNPRYGALGLVALPQVWLFQILLALFAPVVDLMLLVQLIVTYADYLQPVNSSIPPISV